jgi:hypothetical protein
VSLAVLGSVGLSQGGGYLYGQIGELLHRRRVRCGGSVSDCLGTGEPGFRARCRSLPGAYAVGQGPEPPGQTPIRREFPGEFSGTFSSVRGSFRGLFAVQAGKALTAPKDSKEQVRAGFPSTR